MLRFASLGSGSKGNALLVAAGDTHVLVDNGFGLRDTLRRLERAGVAPATLSAILVTHEHSDHGNGVVPLASRYGIPVHLTAGTKRALEARGHFDGVSVDCRRIVRGQVFSVGDLAVLPVRVPHDAAEPCQFVFEYGPARLGVLTDIGSLTPQVVEAYAGCDALFLECNHDARMLAGGAYPPALKARVGGDFGHLSNTQAVQLLQQVNRERLATLVIGHLSEKNNDAPLARRAVAAVLGWHEDAVIAASQAEGHDWLPVRINETRAAGASGA
ncbi:MAG: MBL fold metallo-hydrolase [Pseudomonadota bacterium]